MTYKEGIVDAIQQLGDRTGSSSIAIRKVMQSKLPKDKKWLNTTYLSALKTGVANGDFVQNKNSYKLSAEYKKKLGKSTSSSTKPTKKKATKTVKKKTTKKAVPSKKKTVKKTTTKKKPAAKGTKGKKKTTTKKSTTKSKKAKK